jgi:hypothetical protein
MLTVFITLFVISLLVNIILSYTLYRTYKLAKEVATELVGYKVSEALMKAIEEMNGSTDNYYESLLDELQCKADDDKGYKH